MTTHRWKRLDYSPYNPSITGDDEVDNEGELPTKATLVKVVNETENVKTFRFIVPRRIAFLPGQCATFEFHNIPNGEASEIRTWTLSETPNSVNGDNTLDITVKRIPNGLVTNWLHEHAKVGLEVKLNGIQGDLTAVQHDLETNELTVPKNLLLLSAGIGITPSLAMIRGIGAFELENKTNITMIHVERYAKDLLSQTELLRRARTYRKFKYVNVISSEQGRLNKTHLQAHISNFEKQQIYICGPSLFMRDMTNYLVELGVRVENIHTESFEF